MPYKIDSSTQYSPEVLAYRRRYQRRAEPTSSGLVLKQSVASVTKQYCTESSICGLKHLVDDRTPFIERVIWVITLIGALVCSVSLVWMTFTKYYQAPLVTTQIPEGVPVSTIIFPAVGICTTNRISKMAAVQLARKLLKEERNKKYNESEILSLIYNLGQFYIMQPMERRSGAAEQLNEALGNYDPSDLMKSLTPKCEDMLMTCAWNEIVKNCTKLFDFRLTANGYCCTFNYLRQSDSFEENSDARSIDMYKYGNQSNYDYDQGLKVLMRINESDDFFYSVPMEGAQLQFSDAYDFPDAPSGSYAMQMISPRVQMTVMVSASFTEASRDIQHVDVKLRKCLFYDESSYLPFYTSSDCMLKCRMLFLLSKCNCTPFNMPKMAKTKTCDIVDVGCLQTYYAQSISIRPREEKVSKQLELDLVDGGIDCSMCYPTCSKTAYNYDFINVDIYPEELNKAPDSERLDWLRGANFTGASIVHVKYARDTADCYGQNVIMKWFDLISNIGSTCGFVTGFSFVSVLEFIYFFTVKLVRELRLRRQQNRFVHSLDNDSSAHHAPVSMYRPIYWNELHNDLRGRQNHNFK